MIQKLAPEPLEFETVGTRMNRKLFFIAIIAAVLFMINFFIFGTSIF